MVLVVVQSTSPLACVKFVRIRGPSLSLPPSYPLLALAAPPTRSYSEVGQISVIGLCRFDNGPRRNANRQSSRRGTTR